MSVWQELGNGVFRRRYALLDQNVGLVCGDDAALLVDTRPTPSTTRELLNELRRLTALPIRHVVDTHFHFDHTFGNEWFPHAVIWGHRRCLETLRASGERHRQAAMAWAPDLAAELAGVRIVAPTRAIETSIEVLVGGRPVELHAPGRGHTDGDLIVLIPDADVAFAGDLIEEGAPPSFEDSYPVEWPATVERLLAMAARAADRGTVVPGHGDLVDRAFIEEQLDLLRAVATAARDSRAGRASVQETAARVDLPPAAAEMAIRRAYEELDVGS